MLAAAVHERSTGFRQVRGQFPVLKFYQRLPLLDVLTLFKVTG